jgi:hypothetical protein
VHRHYIITHSNKIKMLKSINCNVLLSNQFKSCILTGASVSLAYTRLVSLLTVCIEFFNDMTSSKVVKEHTRNNIMPTSLRLFRRKVSKM